MPRLADEFELRLVRFASALIDQQRASIVVPPQQPAPGFWFGGGNLTLGPDGALYLVGRYRNVGDSRTGLGAGERGLELAIFLSGNCGQSFQKYVSFSKADLDVGDRRVLSIEGAALHWTDDGVELFVSSEKEGIGYPPGFESFLKPGTGVWTIERSAARSIEKLKDAAFETVFAGSDPAVMHVKDPVCYDAPSGDCVLMYCTHPYCWSSSNSAYAIRRRGAAAFGASCFDFFPRGCTWDIAITRGTCIVDVPQVGPFSDRNVSLLFYDGGESLRNFDEHSAAVKRPRGYSCEELGGVAYFLNGDLSRVYRLSKYQPMFVSPQGTGCSRYVDVLSTPGGIYATWQQSQRDLSQPLVMNFVDREQAEKTLG